MTIFLIIVCLFLCYLIYEISGLGFIVDQYAKHQFSARKLEWKMMGSSEEEKELYRKIYNLIDKAPASEYIITYTDYHKFDTVMVGNVEFDLFYSYWESKYDVISITVHSDMHNPRKHNAIRIPANYTIREYLFDFAAEKIYNYFDQLEESRESEKELEDRNRIHQAIKALTGDKNGI